ncbi:threonine ammonia-lyase [Agrococcus sp. SL85]|uniref:threonine ammonia-lyase n=1 Tax=Agrococcus sp. SL85 TaxID=2995141 RepID=UPI00226D1B75|nr:threonine ammonia-lyase [Agrococcus sp. SL85]WAC65335.1 threonine ammonia-lyase [Agrococcus sp. SL85]
MSMPDLAGIEAARERLRGIAQETPMERSRYLSGMLGAEVFLKCENLQRTGAYKIRGAYNMLAKLRPEEAARGVVAASAGNHAQGVAFAATELGMRATIFMPLGVALPKLQATRDYGAEVELRGQDFQTALAAAVEHVERTGATFVPPYDHPDIVEGQGTLGLEILEQVPEVATIVVPIGGGGLAAGVAAAVRQRAAELGRTVRIVGVQAERAASYPPSIGAGEPTTIRTQPTIADGIAVARPGALPFEIIRDAVDEIVTVSDDDIARALIVLLERAKLVVEPAGAVTTAAIMRGLVPADGPTVAVVSGGNIDPLFMERVIGRGLAASQRYLKVRLALPDRPGQLAIISQIVSDEQANVVEVLHTQHDAWTSITDVSLDISVTTRGPEHAERVLEALRRAGYEPVVL